MFRTRLWGGILAATAMVAAMLTTAPIASATTTSAPIQSGVRTAGCAVDWSAQTNVTVRIAADSTNFALNGAVEDQGLSRYWQFDGDPKYTRQAPGPDSIAQAADGSLVLTWSFIPAGSANVFAFTGTPTDGSNPGDPANHYFISAQLTGTYAEGSGCATTAPPAPTAPVAGECEQVLTGRGLIPVGPGDVTVRDKWGVGGETNVDSWGGGTGTRYVRLGGPEEPGLLEEPPG